MEHNPALPSFRVLAWMGSERLNQGHCGKYRSNKGKDNNNIDNSNESSGNAVDEGVRVPRLGGSRGVMFRKPSAVT